MDEMYIRQVVLILCMFLPAIIWAIVILLREGIKPKE